MTKRELDTDTVRRIQLTQGNIGNQHIYLRGCSSILPADCVGGGNKEKAGRPVRVKFEPGGTVDTDVDGKKWFFRERKAVRAFLEGSAAEAGDWVIVERVGDRSFEVRMEGR